MLFPLRYYAAGSGLDASWATALNYFHIKDIIFGRDVAFTFGPLAYLIIPMPFGNNLALGVLFQLACWLLFAGWLGWCAFRYRIPAYGLAIAAICALAGVDLLHGFGANGPDFFLVCSVLLLLGSAACDKQRWLVPYAAAGAISALLLLIKLSSGISALSAFLLLPLSMLPWDRLRARKMLLAALSAPLFFLLFYLLYYPSLSSLWRYLRLGLDISSSYSVTMTDPAGGPELPRALALNGLYGLLIAALFRTRRRSFPLAVAGLGPLFLEFKHSFVRKGDHAEIFFTFLPLLLALVLLFTDWTPRPRWPVFIPVLLMAGLWVYQEHTRMSPRHLLDMRGGLHYAAASAEPLLDFPKLHRDLLAASQRGLAPDRLPPELLARIGGASTGIFPWELSYAAANPIDFRPFPVIQSYTVGTPYLDRANAEFLNDPARSPKFLLFEWDALDGRHPLLDIPFTWVALLRQYEFDSAYGRRLLLRKRVHPLDETARCLSSTTVQNGSVLNFPASPHPVTAHIYLRLNWIGRLRKFFYQFPHVYASFSSSGPGVCTIRASPQVLEDGIATNFLPCDLAGARLLLEEQRAVNPPTDMILTGPGLAFLDRNSRVDFYELPGIPLSVQKSGPPDLRALAPGGVLDTAHTELLNDTNVTRAAPGATLNVAGQPALLVVQGWAFDEIARLPASAVVLDLDGKLYPTVYGDARPDIAAAYQSAALLHTSFWWKIPMWKLSRTEHLLTIKVVSAGGETVYSGKQTTKFRIVD